MKKLNLRGVVLVIAGVLTAVGPQYIFPICSGMNPKSPCYYTGLADIGAGLVLTLLGLLILFDRNEETVRGLLAAALINGIQIILIPTVLIGVCKGSMMTCHAATRPFLILLGILIILTGGSGVLRVERKKKSNRQQTDQKAVDE